MKRNEQVRKDINGGKLNKKREREKGEKERA